MGFRLAPRSMTLDELVLPCTAVRSNSWNFVTFLVFRRQ